MKIAMAMALLCVAAAFAQTRASAKQARAACGPENVQFSAKVGKGENLKAGKPAKPPHSEDSDKSATNEKTDNPAEGGEAAPADDADVNSAGGANPADSGGAPEKKPVIFVVENMRAVCLLCDTTTRIGMDGAWMGATSGNSYFSFQADPGEHHLCANLQSAAATTATTSLASFTAEAGKVYYFRVRLTDQNTSGRGGVEWALDLEPIDNDEGQFLVASFELSTFRRKK